MIISKKIKEWIKRFKFIKLCKECGIDPDTGELKEPLPKKESTIEIIEKIRSRG